MAHPQKPDTTCNHCSSLFNSPTFRFLTSKMSPFDSDFPLISPTSILETNSSIFSSKNPKPSSYLEPTIPNPKRFHIPSVSGLADLVKNRDHSKKPVNKMVLFGSKLRVQIPSTDFGTKTGATGMRYPCQGQGQVNVCIQTKVLTESETEEYTRVISHGPNPTITHILDNSVFVEATPCLIPLPPLTKNSSDSFLTHCYTCKKNLDQNQDIFIYRGEKGFCSSECRYKEMLLDQMES